MNRLQRLAHRTIAVTMVALVASLMSTVGPASVVAPAQAAVSGDGLKAYYRVDNRSASTLRSQGFEGFVTDTCHTETATTINFNWGTAKPGGTCPIDNFTALYTGYVLAPATGEVTFRVSPDDAFLLEIDGVEVAKSLQANSGTPYTETITMTSGQIYKIDLWYRELGSGAQLKMEWSYDGSGGFRIVPQSNLGTSPSQLLSDAQVTATCQIGSSPACPAYSPQELVNLYGTNTDGVYWLLVAGVPTRAYLRMNAQVTGALGDGLVMIMRGAPDEQQGFFDDDLPIFHYDSRYWTDPHSFVNSQSDSHLAPNSSGNLRSAKFNTFNYTPATHLVGILSKNGTRFASTYQGVSEVPVLEQYGHPWFETMPINNGVARPVELFSWSETRTEDTQRMDNLVNNAFVDVVDTRTVRRIKVDLPPNADRTRGRWNKIIANPDCGGTAADDRVIFSYFELCGYSVWYGFNFVEAEWSTSSKSPRKARWGVYPAWVGNGTQGEVNRRNRASWSMTTGQWNEFGPAGIGLSKANAAPDVHNAGLFGDGQETYAFEMYAKMPDPTLSAPTSATVEPGPSRNALLAWNPVSGATEYVVQYVESGTSWANAQSVRVLAPSASAPTADITGLKTGYTYQFRVFARSDSNPLALNSSPAAVAGTVTVARSIGSGTSTIQVTDTSTVRLHQLLESATAGSGLVLNGFEDSVRVGVTITAETGTVDVVTSGLPGTLYFDSLFSNTTKPAASTSVTFYGDTATVEKALTQVTYQRPASGPGATSGVSIDIEAFDAGDDTIYYSQATGHYYEIYETATSWGDARCQALYGSSDNNALSASSASMCADTSQRRNYQGLNGYMATVSTAAENAFIYSIPSTINVAWLGGYASQSMTGSKENWKWLDGPESGLQFYTGNDLFGTRRVETYIVGGQSYNYAPWKLANPDSGDGDTQDALFMYLKQISAGNQGDWNDGLWTRTANPANNSSEAAVGAVFEYSTADGLRNPLSAERTLTIPGPVQVLAASSDFITQTSAVITTQFNAGGVLTNPTVYYGTDQNAVTNRTSSVATSAPASLSGTTAETVTATLAGLQPGTTYHYAVVGLRGGSPSGDATSGTFTTLSRNPDVTTLSATGVESTTAVLAARITPNSSGAVTPVIEYSTSSAMASPVAVTESPTSVTGFSPVVVTANITGLQPNTTYYVRAAAGASQGSVVSFTTAPAPASNQISNQAATANNLSVAPVHGKVFYVDLEASPKIDAAYIGYTVTNSGNSAMRNIWAELKDFSGGSVSLANAEDARQQILTIPANSSRTVYFLLKATQETTMDQTHTIRITQGDPRIAGSSELYNAGYTFTKVQGTIKAAANKVTDVYASTISPVIGGVMTITVTGQPGTIGAGQSGADDDGSIIWLTPTAYSSWPTRSLQLESVRTEIGLAGSAAGCQSVYTDQLVIRQADGCHDRQNYTVIYTFRVIGTPTEPFVVAPVAQIASGTQYKHTDIAGSANQLLAVIPQQSVTITGDTSATATPGSSSGTSDITQTVTVGSTSNDPSRVPEVIIDPGAGMTIDTTSVTASSGGSSIPTNVVTDADGNVRVYGDFTVSASQPTTITYNATVPDNTSVTTTFSGTAGDQPIGVSPGTNATESVTVTGTTATSSSGTAAATATLSALPAMGVYGDRAELGLMVYAPRTGDTVTVSWGLSSTLFGAQQAQANPASLGSNGEPLQLATYVATGLEPGALYFYRFTLWRAGVAISTSEILTFSTARDDIPFVNIDNDAMPTIAVPESGQSGAVDINPPIRTNYTGDLDWSVSNGDLPPGLSIDPDTGRITGTPTQPGTYSFTVNVQSSATTTVDGETVPAVQASQPYVISTLPAGANTAVAVQDATAVSNTSAVLPGAADFIGFGQPVQIRLSTSAETSTTLVGDAANPTERTVVDSFGSDTSSLRTIPVGAGVGSEDQRFSWTLTGLEPNTTYYYQFITPGGESEIRSFTTTSEPVLPPLPAVSGGAPASLAHNAARIQGVVDNATAGDLITIVWGTAPDLLDGTRVPAGQASGLPSETVSLDLANLTPNTTYYFRVVTRSGESTIRSFTTPEDPAVLAAQAAAAAAQAAAEAAARQAAAEALAKAQAEAAIKAAAEAKARDEVARELANAVSASGAGAGGGGVTVGGSTSGSGAGTGGSGGSGSTGTGGTGSGGSGGAGSGQGTAGGVPGSTTPTPAAGAPRDITLSGLPAGAQVRIPSGISPARGVSGVTVNGSTVTVTPIRTFSGRTSVTVEVVVPGRAIEGVAVDVVAVPVTVDVVVAPAPVTRATHVPVSAKRTTITWRPVANATSYEVYADESMVCRVALPTCEIRELLGPKTPIRVVSLGGDNTISSQVIPTYAPKQPALATRVRFAENSAVLTADAKRILRESVALVKAQGFTKVTIVGHTDAQGGNVNAGPLSNRRATAVATFMRRLITVEKITVGKGLREPVASNDTKVGQAKNRRAEVFVR